MGPVTKGILRNILIVVAVFIVAGLIFSAMGTPIALGSSLVTSIALTLVLTLLVSFGAQWWRHQDR